MTHQHLRITKPKRFWHITESQVYERTNWWIVFGWISPYFSSQEQCILWEDYLCCSEMPIISQCPVYSRCPIKIHWVTIVNMNKVTDTLQSSSTHTSLFWIPKQCMDFVTNNIAKHKLTYCWNKIEVARCYIPVIALWLGPGYPVAFIHHLQSLQKEVFFLSC